MLSNHRMVLLLAMVMLLNCINMVSSFFLVPSSSSVVSSSARRGRGGGRGGRAASYVSMNLNDQINSELKEAMKAKEKDKLSALRNIRAAFLNAMKEDGADTLPDDQAMTILRKLQKQRQESIEMFLKAPGREDMVDAEKAELVIIESYLPKLADEATTRKWVEAAIAESGATAPKDMGKVMGVMMKKHKAEIDGKLVQQIATEILKSKAG